MSEGYIKFLYKGLAKELAAAEADSTPHEPALTIGAASSSTTPLKSAFGPGSLFDSSTQPTPGYDRLGNPLPGTLPNKRELDDKAPASGRSNFSGFGVFGAFGKAKENEAPNLPAWGGYGTEDARALLEGRPKAISGGFPFVDPNKPLPTDSINANIVSFNKPAGGGLFGQVSTSTPAASTGGFGFGQQQQQQSTSTPAASGGMFGSFGQNNAATNTTNTASTGGLYGQKPAAPATGGLFGQQQQQNTAQPATGGLFGQQTQQNASQPAAGGLFGAASQAKPAGGLFGQQSTTTPATGGLFGQQQQQQQQPAAGGGLFGAQSQTKPAGGLFGSTTQQPAQGGGLFGSTTQQQPQQTGGLFGSTQQQPQQAGSLFNKPAGGLLGGSTSTFQQPQQQSGVSKTTKFSELPEGVQKVIEQMDAFFKDQRHVGQTIDAEPIGRAIWQTSSDIKVAHDEAAAIAQGLDALKHSLERLAAKVHAQAADLQKLLETWEAAKPADARHPGVRPVAHRDFPQEFFARVAEEEAERVLRYKRNIQLLSRAVVSLGADAESMTPQVVVQTIQNNQAAVLALAAQLEGLEMRMNTLRANFT